MLLATLLVPHAHAIPIASPADNGRLTTQLNILTGSSFTSMLLGLAPFWSISVPAEIAAFGTEMGVINTPASFSPPADKSVHTYDDGDSDLCRYDLAITAGKDADTARFYFFTTDRLLSSSEELTAFGNLGDPDVYHPHGNVRVSADNPASLAEGVHTIHWQAETRVNTVLDIALPTILIANTLYSEKKQQEQAISKQIDAILKKLKDQGKDATPFATKNAENLARIEILRGNARDSLTSLARSFGLAQVPLDAVTITTARNLATQNITVWDEHPPYYRDSGTSRTVEQQDIALEATDFGGVRLGRVSGALQNRFTVIDDCNRPTTLTLLDDDATLMKIGEVTPIRWQLQDDGPYPSTVPLAANQRLVNGNVITTLTQNVTVADTQPPLLLPPDGFARESGAPIDLTTGSFPLGRPKIVDLADPRPTFSNNRPDRLEPDRRYAITWQARDASGNVTLAPPDDPDRYTQYVTIKTPGTNTAPVASAASAETTTATAVEITLTAIDNDILDGRPDPLAFKIQDYPGNGQFEAPLLPFFIEDFRLSPVGDNETVEDNEIVRTSPLGALADAFRLASESGRGTLLNSNYCANGQSIPTDFVYRPSYVHVDDDGFYYVRDAFWSCRNSASAPLARISKWNEAGELLAMRDISSLATATTVIDDEFSVDGLGWIWFPTITFSTDADEATHVSRSRIYGMNRDLDFFQQYGEITTSTNQLGEHDKLQDMAVNTNDQIFYELRGFGFRVKPLDESFQTNRELELSANYATSAFRSSTFEDQYPLGTTTSQIVEQPVHENVPMAQRDGFTSVPGQCLRTTGDGPIFTYNVLQDSIVPPIVRRGTYYRFQLRELCPLATDIEVDSEGYVYITQRDLNRILKYEPAFRDPSGTWQTGRFIGWMGDCTGNRQNSEGVFYNACDEALGISRGFQCSDEKCMQAHNEGAVNYDGIPYTSFHGGSQPGAFNSPASMKMGPRDILYVADTGNSRVQRFGADGAFAGEARSTGTGINQGDNGGFMLGNFGRPYSLSVNSSAFYVINSDSDNGDNFLHVFRTLPFYDVTDNSAKIRYVSDFNFQGNDSFSYLVDDGIATSPAAPVSVSVSRAFRPPEGLRVQCYAEFTSIEQLSNEIPCRLDEDTLIYLHVTSKDPDGFISTGDGGLDQHSFSVTLEPLHGRLSPLQTTDNGAVYAYTPAEDYNGADRFAFNAFDGVDQAAKDVVANVVIDPVPDPVDIDLAALIKAPRGFNRMITAPFDDVDANFQPELVRIRWGDGTQTVGDTWANSGHFDDNGNEISPQVDFTPDSAPVSITGGRPGTGKGMLVAGHTYQNAGNHEFELLMTNHGNDGEPNLQTLRRATVEVVEATVVTAVMNQPDQPVDPDTAFDFEVLVTNQTPQFWPGRIAGNTSASIELPDGMSVTRLDSGCTGNRVIDCQLGNLAVGETRAIRLGARIDLATALVNTQIAVDITLMDDGPHFQDANVSTVSIVMADQDEDAVIDVADAFPTDARYAEDLDGDGLADDWEREFGLDPGDRADAARDPDGDGATNLTEFRQATFPRLAETTAPPEAFSQPGGGEDRLGYRVAAGDINGDGYSDVVAGAPGYQGQGAVMIYYGSANGIQPQSPLTIAGTTGLGLAVAVGDLDGDGLADIAVTGDQAVHLIMGSTDALPSPILIPRMQAESTRFGHSLLITDLDNDGTADLLIGDPGFTLDVSPPVTPGMVFLYRAASRYWLATDPRRDRNIRLGFARPGGALVDEYRFGDSMAAGDIDGDGLTDLMVGAAFPDPLVDNTAYSAGVVAGFLGRNIDFASNDNILHDFTLFGETPGDAFGYSVASGQDLDGDGRDDLLVGAYANNGTGAAYVYQGATQDWWLNPTPVRVKLQRTRAGDQFGIAVAMTPPTAYTGRPAILVGSNHAEGDSGPDEGRVDFYSDLVLAEPWLTLHGNTREMLGYSVASAGDINNDGEPDYVIGAPDLSTPGYTGDGGSIRIYAARGGVRQVDTDGDFVADTLDNCVTDANTDQFDRDKDGIGDICDASPDSPPVATGNGGGGGGGGGAPTPLMLLLMLGLLLWSRRLRSPTNRYAPRRPR